MPSKHLVDPELLGFVEQLPTFEFDPATLPQLRAVMNATRAASTPPTPAGVVVSERTIPGPAGAPDVRVVISQPAARSAPGPGILHIHGGGYVMGAPEMGLASDAAYVLQLNATVVSVDYRLAPETPFPGPVEDCYAALLWLKAEAGDLGVDISRLVITGESAGGGLAAALALLARDRGEVTIAFQHLIFPMLDDRTVVHPDPSPVFGQFVWNASANHFGWSSLLGGPPGAEGISPYAAPARAEDLSGLPPTFMICGALDLFLEEDLEYTRRLIRAGVPTELHIYPGAPHAFMLAENAQVTKAFVRDSLNALKRAVGG